MLEHDLLAAAERVAPPVPPDLAESVLARLDEPSSARRRVVTLVAVVATAVAALGFSPQVRAFAADLLGLTGISIGREEPSAPPSPSAPLPDTRPSDLERAAAAADFALGVPAALGVPDSVTVAGEGRVVSMSWREGTVVLDQLDGSMGPVFEKQVGGLPLQPVEVDGGNGGDGWWVAGPHDLVYVTPSGQVVSATARLAGRTLLWERAGVTYRLEGALTRAEAIEVAGTLEAPAG